MHSPENSVHSINQPGARGCMSFRKQATSVPRPTSVGKVLVQVSERHHGHDLVPMAMQRVVVHPHLVPVPTAYGILLYVPR